MSIKKEEIPRKYDNVRYDLNEVRFYLTTQGNEKATTADAIEYVRSICKKCYVEKSKCKRCELHELMNFHVKKKLFKPFVYRNLAEYGNCYINRCVKLSDEQIFDLKVFGFPNITYSKGKNSGGIIIKVIK